MNDVTFNFLAITDDKPLVYIKAYTTGSCRNMCGRVLSDCSCDRNCMLSGTCCSDYNGCSSLVVNDNNSCRNIPNCKLCNTRTNECGMCDENYYLFNGRCVSKCEEKRVTVFATTHTCYDTHGSLVF